MCFVFTFFCIPEVCNLTYFSLHKYTDLCLLQTKGLSLEQIDLMYQNTIPVKSLEYRRRLLTEEQEHHLPTNGEKKSAEDNKA